MIRKTSFVVAGIVIGVIGTIGLTQPQMIRGGANAASSDTYRELNLFGDIFERVRAGLRQLAVHRQTTGLL